MTPASYTLHPYQTPQIKSSPTTNLDLALDESGSSASVDGVGQVRRQNDARARADHISKAAERLVLAVEATRVGLSSIRVSKVDDRTNARLLGTK